MSKNFKNIRAFILCFVLCGVVWSANTLDELEYNEDLEGVEVEAIISYKLELRDSIPVGERYRVSQAMQYKPSYIAYVCHIDVGAYDITDDMPFFIIALLKAQKEEVLDCLYRHQVLLKEEGLLRNNNIRNYSLLEIPAVRVRVSLQNRDLRLKVLLPIESSKY